MKNETIILIIVIAGVGLLGGIWLGMIFQQMIFTASLVEFGESLEGTNIEINVNLNETQLIEGFRKTIIPILNQTNQENGTAKTR